jgi:hypothetical protein
MNVGEGQTSQHSSRSIHVGCDLRGVCDWMGVGIVPCLDPSESMSPSKAAGICTESDDSTLSSIVGFEVGDSFVHERAVGTSTVFMCRCARDEIQLVGSRRRTRETHEVLAASIQGLFIASWMFWDFTGERLGEWTMRERRKRRMGGGVQCLPFSYLAPVSGMNMAC